MTVTRREFLATSAVATASAAIPAFAKDTKPAAAKTLTVVVMDPLSAPLACDCVQGYAQRKYETLAQHLKAKLGCSVKMVWNVSLSKAMKDQTAGKADLIIGKHSVVLFDAKKSGVKVRPIASLTGKDGKTTQTGLIVVRKADPAVTVEDIKGYRIFFGPADCDEKWKAPRELLKLHGVPFPKNTETSPVCSAAATKLVGLPADAKAAAVISSYAEPLLEGCGNIKKGDLRIVGVTNEIPFVTAFVNADLDADTRKQVRKALLGVGKEAPLTKSLETKKGFVAFGKKKPAKKKKK